MDYLSGYEYDRCIVRLSCRGTAVIGGDQPSHQDPSILSCNRNWELGLHDPLGSVGDGPAQ